jgi:hypothetical protein
MYRPCKVVWPDIEASVYVQYTVDMVEQKSHDQIDCKISGRYLPREVHGYSLRFGVYDGLKSWKEQSARLRGVMA